ncbi:two-component system LytT family response regulator [Inhella inkyongensis]|uniref:Two-component system LytT family response regulator n=1 Tax=Inhella inkyongensis TaxID=392593 RepID=A0A840S2X1_9BURK|nr:LytTR family DNA-binding domain-containing protein [Inhella inkyongensis]MBB5202930.1 two-component system LytT family response regulator [Inhella inkyongensis]
MNPVRLLIADDEPIARAGLRHLLARETWLTVVGEAADGPATLAAVQALRPELLLLDIQMPGFSGLELLQRLPAEGQPLLVFTTAHAEHAISAFELGALDYLLKPFGAERLQACLGRVRAALGEPCAPALARWAEVQGPGSIQRLFLRQGLSIVPVAVADIASLEAEGDYVALQIGSQRNLLHLALSRLEARLDPQCFVRIHRGCLVNLDQVLRFRRLANGQLEAEMRDGRRLGVSRSQSQALRNLAQG